MPALGTRGVRSLQEVGITASSSKCAYSHWLSATGDDEDLFYYRVAGPHLPSFLSGASTVPACEHTQCRACYVVAKFQQYDQQLEVDHGGAAI